MTFQEYIQQLQIQFENDGGYPKTDDVCEAIAVFDCLKPKLPLYSFQLSFARAWLNLNAGVKIAESELLKGHDEFNSLLDSGTALHNELIVLWDDAKDLQIMNLETIKDAGPDSGIYELYAAIQSFDVRCEELHIEACEYGKFRMDYSWFQKYNRSKRDDSGKRFSKEELQEAIDAVRTKTRKAATKGKVYEKLGIKDIRTFNKHLEALNISDDDFKSAAKGEIKIK